MNARLVPELYVFDLQESLDIYTSVLGFRVLYDRMESQEGGNRQFVVSDSDGYLLRFYSDLGNRPIQN